MKADVAKQSLWTTSLLATGLLAAFFFLGDAAPEPPADILLGGAIDALLRSVPWLAEGLLLFLTAVCALRITRITTRGMVYVVRSFLSIVFFVIIACGLYITSARAVSMVVVWLLITASNYLIASFRRAHCFDRIFKGGLMMGLLPLLWPPALLLWIGMGAALRLFRRSWREGIVAVTALLLPTALWGYVEWLRGGEFTHAALSIKSYLIAPSGYEPLAMDGPQIVLSCLMLLLLFLSTGTFLGQMRTMRTRPARIVLYFVWMSVAAGGMFLLPCRSAAIFPILATGLAVIAPIYFVRHKGTTPAVLYGAILVGALIVAIV